MRYQVHDDEGVLRTFSRKEEAESFMKARPELKLVVLKKAPKKEIDLNKFEDAPFWNYTHKWHNSIVLSIVHNITHEPSRCDCVVAT